MIFLLYFAGPPGGTVAFAIAPDPSDLIPGVTCFQGRRKREAQGPPGGTVAFAIAPDPQDLLPPCPSCFTEKGYVCKLHCKYL